MRGSLAEMGCLVAHFALRGEPGRERRRAAAGPTGMTRSSFEALARIENPIALYTLLWMDRCSLPIRRLESRTPAGIAERLKKCANGPNSGGGFRSVKVN